MPESMQLREAFASVQSRMGRTVVVIDMINSTAMKEDQTQAAWLNSLGWEYDTVTAIATEAVAEVVVKYLGDGIMLVFDIDHTTDAINVAIRIQETITKAGEGMGGAKGVIDFTCSVGMSTGEVIGFTTPSGAPDFVGAVVDKAFRLCSAANAQAIFVDAATLGAANMMRINSIYGLATARTSDQYQGDMQKAVLKGFGQPAAYHEILWAHQLYGVKSAAVTASTDRLRPAPTQATPARAAARNGASGKLNERHSGVVKTWLPERSFGFIHDPRTGEDFHFTARLLAYPEDAEKLAKGREVAFIAIAGADPTKNRQAAAVLVVGEPADGPLVSLPPERPYGWLRVEDELGHGHLVYVPIKALTERKVGDMLGFIVGANDKGAIAQQVELVEEDHAA
jgi:class 3 adenylate cyclase/cold shock CspA family protein